MTSVAVALLYQADSRALRLSLFGLARQSVPPSKVFLVVKAIGERAIHAPALESWPVLQIEVINVLPRENIRDEALRAVESFNTAIVIREGMILPHDFVAQVRSENAMPDAPVAVLIRATRSIDINVLVRQELGSPDPVALGSRRSGRVRDRLLARLQSRYFTPSALVLQPAACRKLWFEPFALRSDWSAYRLFLDSAARRGPVLEIEGANLLYIGRQPDRRGGYEQGKTCSTELYRLAEAHPEYRTRAWLDRKLLGFEQIVLLSSPRHARSTWAFLRGMFSRRGEEAALRYRLRRDISRMS